MGLLRPVRSLAEKIIVIPVKEKVYTWRRVFKKDLGSCQLQNESALAELKAKIASLTEENLSQKRLLSAPLPQNWQFLPVKVINLEGEVIFINAGREEGIKEGMIAIFGSTYIGRVAQVSEKMAAIRLPSFLDEKLVVKIAFGQEAVLGKGLLVGRGEGQMRVEQILTSETIDKGNLVLASQEGGDLLVGEIEEVLAAKGEVFKTARVKRLFNPEELTTIFLIRGKI